MEISSVESDDDFYKNLTAHPQESDHIGKTLFWLSSFIALTAVVPAVIKKNRIYTAWTGIAEGRAVQPIQVVAEDAPLAPSPQCTPEEKRKVENLFGTLADATVANLVWNALNLIRLGNEIDHLHPFALLFAMPRDKIRLTFVNGNRFKIQSVLDGINKGMQREIQRNNINRFIPDFCALMGVDENRVRDLIQHANWDGLMRYLYT
jgi:hypothetical protein